MDGPTFSLTLPSEMRMLSVARGFVDSICSAYELDSATTHALVIVTGEVITNIVRHAHQHRSEAQMHMQLEILTDVVVMRFVDEGEPFDLESVPQLPPGELRIGGRGLYLMRALMDELTYEPRREGACGNVMRLMKRRKSSASMRECG